jgi:FMN reductase
VYIVGIGGSPNNNSTTETVLRRGLAEAERLGAETRLFGARDLEFPLFAEDEERTPAVVAFLRELERCDGLILASPAYHGNISGRIKNALDYVEDLRSNDPPYLDGRVVGCIAVGAAHLGAVTTLNALCNVAHALRGWPAPMRLSISSNEPLTERVDLKLYTIVKQVMGKAPVLQ